MMNKHKLTNLMISQQYRNIEYWLMRSDFTGAFMYWVTVLSPYDKPDHTKALNAFVDYIKEKKFKKGFPYKFRYLDIEEMINEKVFESIPEIEKLNHPKIDNGAPFKFVSRYDGPGDPDEDFIDLGALARNIKYMIMRNYITDMD